MEVRAGRWGWGTGSRSRIFQFSRETYSQDSRYDKMYKPDGRVAPGFALQGSKLLDLGLQPETQTRTTDCRRVVEKIFGEHFGVFSQ